MPEDKKLYLSETIDYDRDIAPYQFIKIYAGVGSGKNGFVDRLIQGGYFKHADGSDVEKQHVLLITSRRSKVDEQLNSDDVVYDPVIGAFDGIGMNWLGYDPKYEDYYNSPTMLLPDLDGWGEMQIYRRSCVNTNAKIEWNLKEHYQKQNAASHPWERFDIIVIDEVHAVLADACYQSAPFYVRRLIEETLKNSTKCKVIVMTGTPDVLDDYALFKEAHLLNRMESCICVRPQAVAFITREEARAKQEAMLKAREKFIAFFNHIKDTKAFLKEYAQIIAVSFSDVERRREFKKEDAKAYNRMIETEQYIANHKRIPDDLVAFMTTGKNKEGINIENEDIRTMFIEVHSQVDVVQMAGRVRHAVEKLYVVIDSKAHPDMESRHEDMFSEQPETLHAINHYYQALCAKYDYMDPEEDPYCRTAYSIEELGGFIDYIHAKFPYVRFDYFTNAFVYYPERRISKAHYAQEKKEFVEATKSHQGLIGLAHKWYPGIQCRVTAKLESAVYAENKERIDAYLHENNWINGTRKIRQEERKTILKELNELLAGKTSGERLKPLLQKYGYELIPETRSKNANAPYRIEKKQAR